jgi:pilus assembly protein CpaD
MDMSVSNFEASAFAVAQRRARLRVAGSAVPVLAAAMVALLSGCANRDSITVGSVPDDYRTNHPIVISEKDEKIDLPVGAGDRGMTKSQRQTLLGFLDGYDRSAAPVLTIAVPSGSANEIAARSAARDFKRTAVASGVHSNRVAMTTYQVSSADISAPVRVAFSSMRAHTDRCGRWPEDILETTENKHYADFGCSYQNNLAAQIANPADLLGPRKQTPIDAENRDRVIDIYRERGISDEFLGNSEIDY